MSFFSALLSRRKFLQRVSRYIVLGSVVAGLISCQSNSSQTAADGTQEIEFWTMQLQPQFNDYFNTLIAEYEAENPDVSIRWVDVPWAAMESKILTAVAAGTAPDIVNLNPVFASQLAGRNAWANLDDLVPEAARDEYLPKIWQASTLDGQTFGIPWYLTTRISIYNRDLFEAAAITEPPQTYAELATVAQQIREETGKYAFFVTFVTDDSSEVLESFVQMGVQLVDAEGNAAFDTPEGRAAFQYWVDLYQQELLPREVLTQGHRRASELYQAGELAILSASPEFLASIATNSPQIAEASAAAPQISGDTNKKNVAVMNLVIPQDTEHSTAAVDFALYVTNSGNQLVFATEANVLPSTTEAIADYTVELEATADDDPLQEARVVSAEQLPDAEVLIPAMDDLNVLKQAIYDNLQAAMLDEKTVDQAVTDAANEWNSR